jgi:O-antigen ligase/Flp pilus assembly protein TadD
MPRIIVSTLYLLAIFVPLVFTTINSELFEFPKFILLLSGTLVISASWAIHIYQSRDYHIFKPSSMSYALLAALITQLLATIFSINPYTSFWGYYSRFHGGLLTTICYTIIYFAAINWLDTKSTQKLIKIMGGTSFIIGLYAIMERVGIDKGLWIQDVQSRPFSTLGQPNWLAAYLLPHIFLVLYLSQTKKLSYLLSSIFYLLLVTALLFTRSRSGFLALALAYPSYWFLLTRQFSFSKIQHSLFLFTISSFLITGFVGTPYTPSLSSLLSPKIYPESAPPAQGTQLENGGTESGDIRKIVWSGALSLIKKYPLLGTGPETFAYTYYWVRPTTHNLTSEWDFLYNKAHNEYLNMAATTGLIGLLAYLYFHYAVFKTSFTLIPQSKKVQHDTDDYRRAIYPVLGASIIAFTVTNFFGFSVIPVYLSTVMIATMPITLKNPSSNSLIPNSYLLIPILLVLVYPARLFYADYLYAKGKATSSLPLLTHAISLRPGLDLYHATLGEAYAALGQKDLALKELETNRQLNPYHLNYYKSRAKIYLTLASIEPSFHNQAAQELEKSRTLAPTDPKLAYNLGLVYTRLADIGRAETNLRDAITLKPNYGEPYYALTLLYEQTQQTDKISPLLKDATTHLSTYSGQLKEKIDKYEIK